MFTTRPEIRGTYGVVASTHWLASSSGMAMLEKGGNAFDAAVATGFTLQVVEPHLNGPGGDVPILLWDDKAGRMRAICGQGPAPAGATIAHYTGLGLDLVPGTGLLATVIPGAFDAWVTMLRDWGTLSLREVLEPAIYYAETGHPLVERIANTMATMGDHFREHWPTSAEIYLPGGSAPKTNDLFRNKLLAAMWMRLLKEAESVGGDRERQIEAARKAWSQGFVAEAIDRFSRTQEVMDSSGERHFGVLNGQDMAGWSAGIEDPLTYDYKGYTVAKCGPWSQGPVFLQQLALLKGFDVAAMDPTGPDFVHAVTECAKLAFADREAYYGDPDFVEVPVGTLLSDAYNDERRKLVGQMASSELRPGRPDGRAPHLLDTAALAPKKRDIGGAGEPTTGRTLQAAQGAEPSLSRNGQAQGDTCHVDVIDRWGNMVSATPSGGWLQSSPIIPELGFALNTRGQMFWLQEGLPASLAPGKRPRTTLTPSMALKDGKPYMAFGTPGGDQQDQWQVMMFLHHVDHGMNLQEAIDTPAFHSEHMPSSFWPRQARPNHLVVEGRFPKETVAELEKRGHQVEVGGDWSEGRLCAATRTETPNGRLLRAAANPRGMQGYAVGR